VGQHIDRNGTPYAEGKRAPLDLSRLTFDKYLGCIRYKTSYYSVHLSCALALAYCGYDQDSEEGEHLFQGYGCLYASRGVLPDSDDVLDAFAQLRWDSISIGTVHRMLRGRGLRWICRGLHLISIWDASDTRLPIIAFISRVPWPWLIVATIKTARRGNIYSKAMDVCMRLGEYFQIQMMCSMLLPSWKFG
jgi:hypothetical protein